jgi:hypothetical protein
MQIQYATTARTIAIKIPINVFPFLGCVEVVPVAGKFGNQRALDHLSEMPSLVAEHFLKGSPERPMFVACTASSRPLG